MVINTYPVTLRPVQPRPIPIPSLTIKQLTLVHWLASQEGQSLLSKLPPKAGLLSMATLAARGILRVHISFTPYGRSIFHAIDAAEIQADKRAGIVRRRKKYKLNQPTSLAAGALGGGTARPPSPPVAGGAI